MAFSDCVSGVIDRINNAPYLTDVLGIKADCALWNEARCDAESVARFPLRVHVFGWTQSDGAGKWRPVYHFAVIGKMKRGEQMEADEMTFADVCERIGRGLHQQRINGFSIVATKGFVFDSAMTITSDNRRVAVSLEKDEVGFACFFWASEMAVAYLAEDATDTTVETYDIATAPSSSGGSAAVVEPPLTDAQISAFASKQGNIGKQVF